ncbi:MAG: ABC transporter substrate-binding protein [Acholeplasmatales bacterium]|nr:ABC transporter substrate-binding protein [Acholeplasmatales bacterium]
MTLNPWTGESSVESDYQSYITGSFYTAVLNASHTNWEFANELASGDPIPSSPKNINGKIIAKTWDIPLKSDLRWSYNYETNTAGFPAGHDVLNAYDYIYSFRLALDNSWFRAFTGGSDFANLKIKGAAEYVNAVKTGATQQQLDALWADFGIKAVDSNTLRFQFLEDKSSFDIKYSIGWAPVHQNIYEADPDNYGVDNAHIASSGLYTISYWETGVGSRYTKNPNHPLASTISWTGESVKIIPGTNAQEIAFQAFLNGQLDGVGIPTAHLDDYAENPRVLRSPAGTIFSLNINMCGDVATQQQFFPGSQYVPEPILGNKDFRLALYFSLDRNRLKEYDPKTSPSSMKIGGSYFIDPELGVSYRDSPQGQSVGEDLSQETNGYDFDLALALFKRAVATEIANGNYSAGTSDNYTEISLNILTFDASGGKAIADHWLDFAEHFFGLLVDDDNYVRLTFTRTDKATTPLYDQIRAGNYDLALSAISGNSLDAASFLDVFCSDNRSNFLLNYGYNSNIPEIEVKWTENGRDYWQLLSFDAIVEILNHKSYLADGILATEHNTIDQLVEVFLGSHDLVEVSRSEEDGEYIAPTLYDDHDDTTTDDWAGLLADDDYDSIHGLTLTTQDEDGKVNQWLFIITETFGIYSVLNGYPQQIAYGFSDSDALANALSQEGLVAVDEIALSQTDVDDLVSWFELDTYSDVYIDYHLHAVNTTVGAYLVAILESNDGYFVKVVVEALYRESVQTELDGFVQSVLSEYIASSVHDTVNANTDALVTATPYLANYYNVNSYADAVTAFSAGYTDWFRLYYFQATSPDYNFAPGDYYIRAFTIAGFILFGEWL